MSVSIERSGMAIGLTGLAIDIAFALHSAAGMKPVEAPLPPPKGIEAQQPVITAEYHDQASHVFIGQTAGKIIMRRHAPVPERPPTPASETALPYFVRPESHLTD